MSAAARVGGYFSSSMARAGGTALETGIARTVGELVGLGDDGEGVYVSTTAIAAACFDRGVTATAYDGSARPPSYGVVARVLSILRGIGCLSWDRAYSRRWHPEIPADGIRAEYQGAERGWRFPPRRLALVGWALTLKDGATAVAARVIDAARRAVPNAGPAVEAVKPRTEVVKPSRVPVPASLPINSASTAGGSPPADALDGYSLLARGMRALLDAQRDE